MVRFSRALALVGLLVLFACGPAPAKSADEPSSSPTAITGSLPSPTVGVSTTPTPLRDAVLVGHTDQPPTVIVMKRDGTVLATVPGTGVADQHAVGAYVVVGTGKASSVDARGAVKGVALSAVELFASYPYSPPLIVDSSTAIVGCVSSSGKCSTVRVDLATGAVHTLLTAPALIGRAAMRPLGTSLVLLDISPDSRTAWLERVNSDGGLDVLGVDIQTGAVSVYHLPSAIDDPWLAISRDGKSVAGQEDAGTNSANLAIAHLHIVSTVTGRGLGRPGHRAVRSRLASARRPDSRLLSRWQVGGMVGRLQQWRLRQPHQSGERRRDRKGALPAGRHDAGQGLDALGLLARRIDAGRPG